MDGATLIFLIIYFILVFVGGIIWQIKIDSYDNKNQNSKSKTKINNCQLTDDDIINITLSNKEE